VIIKTDSKAVALQLAVMDQSEPEADLSCDGVYVGKTLRYRLPFFLDNTKLVNPHVSVVGMTGSGKTYLVKSLLAGLSVDRHYSVFIIDWNSEYSDMVEFLCGRVWKAVRAADLPAIEHLVEGVNSVDLSAAPSDTEKAALAGVMLSMVRKFILSLRPGSDTKMVLVVDEAWKLANLKQDLGKLFREGRKFGLMVIAATQLVGDVNNEVLSNAACSFVFRLQGSDNLNGLVSSGLLEPGHTAVAQTLERGSCIVSLIYRGGSAPRRFMLEHVHGFDFRTYTIRGGSMTVNVSVRKLGSVLGSMGFGGDATMRIERFFAENSGGVDIARLVGFLFGVGLGRADVFTFLRAIGIKDRSIAVAIEAIRGVAFEE